MRYLSIGNNSNASGAIRVMAHSDPVCTRIRNGTPVTLGRVGSYGDGRFINYRGSDDPVFVDPCSQCGDREVVRQDTGEWRKDAACYVPGLDLSGHFVNPGKDRARDYSFAASLCEECPVRQECHDYGEQQLHEQPRQMTVVWGGDRMEKGREHVSI